MNDNKNDNNSLLDIFGTSEKEVPQQESQQPIPVSEPIQPVQEPQPTQEVQQPVNNVPTEEPQVNNTQGQQQSTTQNPLENENMLSTKIEIEEKIKSPEEQEERLLDLFMGNKGNVFARGGFSWGTFFYPSIYLLYRKFYKQGAFFLLINALTIFTMYINAIGLSAIVSLVYFIASIIYATKFKREYFEYSKKRVSEIIASTNDYNEQRKICMQEGGTDPKAFIAMALISVLSYSLMGANFGYNFNTSPQETFQVEKEFGLNVIVPDDFKNIDRPYSENTYETKEIYYSDGLAKINDDNNVCTFSVTKNTEIHLDKDTTIKGVGLKYLKKSYPSLTKLKTETHNNIDYETYYDENKKVYNYFYADEESMTLIKLDIDKEKDKTCTEYLKYILENTTK